MKFIKKIYYKNKAPDFFKPSNKQTKFKIFPKIKKTIKPSDVLIITAYDKPYSKIGNLCKKSINLYCKKFKFRKKIFTIPKDFKRHSGWYKIKKILDLMKFKKYKIIMWIDADAVFSRYRDLRDVLDNYHEFYLVSHNVKIKNASKYKNTELAISRLNTGVMIFKNSEFNNKFLNEVWNKKEYSNSGWWDNSALLDVLGYRGELRKNLNDHKGNIKYSKKMKLLPKEWNSIPSASNLDFSLETHNPIIFHTAGYIFRHKKELIEKFFSNKDKIKFIN